MSKYGRLPGAIVSCSRLAPKHLTQDLFTQVVTSPSGLRIAGLSMLVEGLLEDPGLFQVIGKDRKTLAEFCRFDQLPKCIPLFLSIDYRSYLDATRPPTGSTSLCNTAESVVLANLGGLVRMRVTEMARIGREGGIAALVPPIDHTGLRGDVPEKRAHRGILRSRHYAQTVIAEGISDVWVPVVGSTEMIAEGSVKAAIELAVNSSTVKGFVLTGFGDDLSILLATAGKLREAKEDLPIYLRGSISPDVVKAVLKSGLVDLVDTFWVDSLTDSNQAVVGLEDESGKVQIEDLADEANFDRLEPLDPLCSCFVCKGAAGREPVSRACIHHLIKTEEMLASVYLQAHNLHQYLCIFERNNRSY